VEEVGEEERKARGGKQWCPCLIDSGQPAGHSPCPRYPDACVRVAGSQIGCCPVSTCIRSSSNTRSRINCLSFSLPLRERCIPGPESGISQQQTNQQQNTQQTTSLMLYPAQIAWLRLQPTTWTRSRCLANCSSWWSCSWHPNLILIGFSWR